MQDTSRSSASTLADRLRRAAVAHGGQPALHWRGTTLSWSELDTAVTAGAHALVAQAVGADRHPPRVAIALGNTPDFVVSYLGALRAGLIAVPVTRPSPPANSRTSWRTLARPC
ncbi:class I adenylate-forming enzyme family protein [Micromonospora sp. WMMA1363]|nr:class I adenylate-forming enzyme family protein [Micromonospora sp. WMMA1363]MDM4720957.1 class I adenylate-forming enzyme family protein [Micromonospora sp. WMMA1363]